MIDITIFIIFTILISIIIILRISANRLNSKLSYRFSQKLRKISWLKVLKLWFIVQCISGLCSIDNKQMTIVSILGFPLMIIILLLTFYFFSFENDLKPLSEEEEEDFKNYKKQFDRDQKIKKILK